MLYPQPPTKPQGSVKDTVSTPSNNHYSLTVSQKKVWTRLMQFENNSVLVYELKVIIYYKKKIKNDMDIKSQKKTKKKYSQIKGMNYDE